MNRRIKLILILMTVCVTGITGLQLYWNYQNYRQTVRTFSHDINEALNTAVDREIDNRHQQIITRFRGWLNDTSIVTITCSDTNRYHETVFRLADTHPVNPKERGVSLSINTFKQKLPAITPLAKKVFINHFANVLLKEDLKKGIVYFYTQGLGDSLSALHKKIKLNINTLRNLYRQELAAKDINVDFQLDTGSRIKSKLYTTKIVNTALNRPYEKEMVWAAFNTPDSYYFGRMKGLLLTSLLLIGITLFCFAYTVRTLLSQHQLARLKDDFINNMTHELNTPLASIGITAEALKTFNHDRETQREYLEMISYQTERLNHLSAQILDLNRSSAKQTNYAQVDVISLLQKVLSNLSPLVTKAQATINFNPPANKISIKGDEAALANVFNNILDNALKYNEGKVVIDISVSTGHKSLMLAFADNGIGIPDVYHQQVFDQFFRVPKGDTHNVKGYGLGLSYVRQVIRQHRGTVTVSTNQPKGTIFTIKLPLA